MKRIIIVVEGDTEKEFVTRVLSPYLNKKGIYRVDCFKIKHSKGGLTKYVHLKKDLVNCARESTAVLTTLIDYYALPTDFPNYLASTKIPNKRKRLEFLENAIKEDVENQLNKKFPHLFPYIQLHEFEAMVFSSMIGIANLYEPHEIDINELKKIVETFPNPEEINENKLTAPSKRLLKIIPGYNKVTDGIMIIEEIGIEKILDNCPRFRQWVELLLEKAKED